MAHFITTDRLTIQTKGEELAEELLTFYQENGTLFEQYDPLLSDQFYTLDYQRNMLLYEQKEIQNGVAMHYYVFLKEHPDKIIGNIDFFRIRPNPFFSTILSYRFHQRFHGQGYALESCQAAIRSMFADYEIHRMEARVAPDNARSIHLLERLGFTYEGLEHESVKIHGAFKDHLRYSLLENFCFL